MEFWQFVGAQEQKKMQPGERFGFSWYIFISKVFMCLAVNYAMVHCTNSTKCLT